MFYGCVPTAHSGQLKKPYENILTLNKVLTMKSTVAKYAAVI